MGKGKRRSKQKKAKPARTGSGGGGPAPDPAPRASSGGTAEAAKCAPVANRECINCDTCGVANPQKCCARCLCYYFCSKECQLEDWKHHKRSCSILKKDGDHYKAAHDQNNLPGGTPAAIEGPCAICLEEEVKYPVKFECGHAFCFKCVVTYQRKEEQSSCPYCRGEIPDVAEKAIERYNLYAHRAEAAKEDSEERKRYCHLAMVENDALSQIYIHPLSVLYFKASMISLSKDPEELLKVTEEILSGIQNLEWDHKEIVCTKLWRAQAYSDMGKWIHASEIYSELREEDQLGGFENEFRLEMGHCQCLFELGDYGEAVESGNQAVYLDRTHTGVHKYLALAQKAVGNIDAARKTMSRAILHEKPWNVENLERNKQILRDL